MRLVRNRAWLATVLGVAISATVAWAQPVPKDPFKGKVKAGKYEDRIEIDMTGWPGVPAGQGKQVNTSQRCLTQEELDKGLAPEEKGCAHSGFKMSGDTATFTTVCKVGADSQSMDSRITMTSDGFTSEVKSSVTQGGKTLTSTMKGRSRYLGPC